MTRHNFLQRRARLLKAIKAASIDYLWSCNITTPQGKRATTFAAKWMMQATRDLWKLGTLSEPQGESPK